MKYIRSYSKYNESLLPAMIGNITGFILTVGLIYGYNAVKSFIKYKRFDMAQKNLEDVILKIENNPELESLFDRLADLIEDGLTETYEFSKLSIEIKNRLREYLTDEEYNRWVNFTTKYFDGNIKSL